MPGTGREESKKAPSLAKWHPPVQDKPCGYRNDGLNVQFSAVDLSDPFTCNRLSEDYGGYQLGLRGERALPRDWSTYHRRHCHLALEEEAQTRLAEG